VVSTACTYKREEGRLLLVEEEALRASQPEGLNVALLCARAGTFSQQIGTLCVQVSAPTFQYHYPISAKEESGGGKKRDRFSEEDGILVPCQGDMQGGELLGGKRKCNLGFAFRNLYGQRSEERCLSRGGGQCKGLWG